MPDKSAPIFPPWLLPIITGIVMLCVGILLERFKARLILLQYKLSFFPLGTSSATPYWGNIQVLHNGRQTNHLSFTTIEITNTSNTDLQDVLLDIWVDDRNQILGESGNYIEGGKAIGLDNGYFTHYQKAIQDYNEDYVLQQQNPSHKTPQVILNDIKWVMGNKLFNIPVWNRKNSIKINLLIENFDGQQPNVIVNITHKACKLVKASDETEEIKQRNKFAGWVSLIFYIIAFSIIYFRFQTDPYILIWLGLLGLVWIFFGFIVYNIKNLIARYW